MTNWIHCRPALGDLFAVDLARDWQEPVMSNLWGRGTLSLCGVCNLVDHGDTLARHKLRLAS